ncbi:MAG TPA: hypothetical protein VGR31_08340 [Planctomycetota bacterium]|nr:hypothetical protein [Planctomycetota bacterium]
MRYAPPVRATAPRTDSSPSRRTDDTPRPADPATNTRGVDRDRDAPASDGPDLSTWGKPVRTTVPTLSGTTRTSVPSARPRGSAPATDGRIDGRNRAPTGRIDRTSILERYRGRTRSDWTGIATPHAPSSGRDLSHLRDKERGGPSVGRKASPPATAPGDRRKGNTRTPPIRGTDGSIAKGTRGTGAKNRDDVQVESIRRLDRLAKKDPTKATEVLKRGREISVATDAAVRTAVGVSLNMACGGNSGNNCFWDPCHQWTNHCAPFWNWWWSPSCTWWWSSCCYPWWGCGYGFGSWYGGCGSWYGGYYGCGSNICYAPYPYYYASVVYDTYEPPAREVIYIEQPADEVAQVADSPVVAQGEGSIAVAAPEAGGIGGGRGGSQGAASHHLELGDAAFREGRYSDAVHDYAKAVELEPGEGVLHLILSDALFATGDYHYAAYALRRALELDPTLVDSVVDKHSFYGDPAEFDRQLDLLERYLEDHFLDDDARLLLSANYLFGGKISQAADLLQSPFSLATKDSAAGRILLERATRLLRESGK